MGVRHDGGRADFEVWTSAGRLVVSDARVLEQALAIVRAGLDEVESACSRFRDDSELTRLTRRSAAADGAVPTRVSPLLADLVRTALEAAARTGGLVDPTVGVTMGELGYDRSIERLPVDGPAVRVLHPVPGWAAVRLDGDVLTLPQGVVLDLGATAKARAADLLAARVAGTLGVGVLVTLGGDIATAGPSAAAPDWQVLVQDTAADPAGQVTLAAGWALATSSTVRRVWHRGGAALHHILDPRTAAPAEPVWRTVTVAARTCVEANTASTAAVVLGHRAPDWLAERGCSARLVDQRLRVVRVGGWPEEATA
jgi:thiamine biosynthesis lipoprotein